MRRMKTRGLGAALSAVLVALLSACGGTAVASAPDTSAPAVDVRAVAEDEISQLRELGYPVDLATFEFEPGFTNSGGGPGLTEQVDYRSSLITISTDPSAYEAISPDIEASVRSLVRHEIGHSWTFWLYPRDDEAVLATLCESSNEWTEQTGTPGAECAAEAISAVLAEERGDERTPLYDLDLSEQSVDMLRPVVLGSLTWETRGE